MTSYTLNAAGKAVIRKRLLERGSDRLLDVPIMLEQLVMSVTSGYRQWQMKLISKGVRSGGGLICQITRSSVNNV